MCDSYFKNTILLITICDIYLSFYLLPCVVAISGIPYYSPHNNQVCQASRAEQHVSTSQDFPGLSLHVHSLPEFLVEPALTSLHCMLHIDPWCYWCYWCYTPQPARQQSYTTQCTVPSCSASSCFYQQAAVTTLRSRNWQVVCTISCRQHV